MLYLDQQRMQARRLSPLDVMKTMDHDNVFLPTGDIKLGDTDFAAVLTAVSLLAGSLVLIYPSLRRDFYPDVDSGAYEMTVRAPSGAPDRADRAETGRG